MDIDDHTSGLIVSGLDVTCVLVNLPSTHEEPLSGRLFRMRNLVDPLQLSGRILFSSIFHRASIILSSTVPKVVSVCLTT